MPSHCVTQVAYPKGILLWIYVYVGRVDIPAVHPLHPTRYVPRLALGPDADKKDRELDIDPAWTALVPDALTSSYSAVQVGRPTGPVLFVHST